jgi:hypothetical protein
VCSCGKFVSEVPNELTNLRDANCDNRLRRDSGPTPVEFHCGPGGRREFRFVDSLSSRTFYKISVLQSHEGRTVDHDNDVGHAGKYAPPLCMVPSTAEICALSDTDALIEL